MSLPRSKVALRFADGSEITAFHSFRLTERYRDPVDTFDCTLVPEAAHRKGYRDRLQKGEIISLLVDEKPQAAMMIETITRTTSESGGYTFDVQAVSPLRLLQEAMGDAAAVSKLYEADTPVLKLIADIVEPFGFTEVFDQGDIAIVKAKTGINPKSQATSAHTIKAAKSQSESNETVYQFISRVLSRLGCMLRCDPRTASLYITAPHYDGDPIYTVKQASAGKGPRGDRFWGDVTVTETNSEQYEFCEVIGQTENEEAELRVNIPKARCTSAQIHAQRPPFRASNPFPHKPAFFKDKNVGSRVRAESVAKHYLGYRAERAFQVRGKVHGLVSIDDVPWTVDTLGRIHLEADELDEVMWLSERTMNQSPDGGQYTDHVWIPKGYLVLGDVAQGQ